MSTNIAQCYPLRAWAQLMQQQPAATAPSRPKEAGYPAPFLAPAQQ